MYTYSVTHIETYRTMHVHTSKASMLLFIRVQAESILLSNRYIISISICMCSVCKPICDLPLPNNQTR